MFNLEYMPMNTKNVFDIFSKHKFIKDYTLVGGTALSIQIEHRKSEDLDFIFDGEFIDTIKIKRSINSIFTKYKVIKEDQNYQIDILINDTKVTFFSSGAVVAPFKIKDYSQSYGNLNIATPNIIGVLKLITISQRNTIRDYYDLYIITKKILSLEELFKLTKKLVPNLAPITYTETLVYLDDIEENNIAEHLDPAEIVSKEEIAEYFIKELKRIKEKIN